MAAAMNLFLQEKTDATMGVGSRWPPPAACLRRRIIRVPSVLLRTAYLKLLFSVNSRANVGVREVRL
jgi:hypothetical protein